MPKLHSKVFRLTIVTTTGMPAEARGSLLGPSVLYDSAKVTLGRFLKTTRASGPQRTGCPRTQWELGLNIRLRPVDPGLENSVPLCARVQESLKKLWGSDGIARILTTSVYEGQIVCTLSYCCGGCHFLCVAATPPSPRRGIRHSQRFPKG